MFQTLLNSSREMNLFHRKDSKMLLQREWWLCGLKQQSLKKSFVIAGYDGELCQIDEDECIGEPCMHGATCVDEGPMKYRCECPRDEETGIDIYFGKLIFPIISLLRSVGY